MRVLVAVVVVALCVGLVAGAERGKANVGRNKEGAPTRRGVGLDRAFREDIVCDSCKTMVGAVRHTTTMMTSFFFFFFFFALVV